MEIPAWVLALLGWSFTLCAWGQAGSSLPPLPWWQGTQVVSNWALPPGLENLVTVVGWGDSAESEAFGDYARRRAARHRFYGRKVVGGVSVGNASATTYSERPQLAQAVICDLEGRPLISQGSQDRVGGATPTIRSGRIFSSNRASAWWTPGWMPFCWTSWRVP